MQVALNNIYINTLIEITFNVSKNKSISNACVNAHVLDRMNFG